VPAREDEAQLDAEALPHEERVRVRLADEVRAREELCAVQEPAQRLLTQVLLAFPLLRHEGEVALLRVLSPQRLVGDAFQVLCAEREAVL